MSNKYSQEELQAKARIFMAEFDENQLSPNVQMVIMMLSVMTNLSAQDCVNRIRELAK